MKKTFTPKPRQGLLTGCHSLQCKLRAIVGFSLVALSLQPGCTQKIRKSTTRDLAGDATSAPPLSQMNLKYYFVFSGQTGIKYPIYMTASVTFAESKNEAIWNSTIESDGGLVANNQETKTLKPDVNLQLKANPANSPASPSLLVFSAGNPNIGRGMSLSVQKVMAGGVPTWKAVSLSYFGSQAQIEDSYLVAQGAAATSKPPSP